MLSARIIKALCLVLDENKEWRDSGLALLEAFDDIDLREIQAASALDAASRKVGRVVAIVGRVRAQLQARLGSSSSAILQIAAE